MYLVKARTETVVLCERCGQELADPESIARGMGPECAMTATQQFAAITDLSLAISTGWIDPVANKFFQEKTIVEAVLNRARQNAEYTKVKNLTRRLTRIKGILVSRELYRQSRMQRKVA
ncbi:MAG: DUF6011 domain-containing protein [Blastocatellia bacterium]